MKVPGVGEFIEVSRTIDIVAEFRAVIGALEARRLEFAVCGGFAVVIHGYVRATKDIDLLIESSAVEAAFEALKPLGFTLRAGPISFGAGTSSERTLFRATKVVENSHLTIDLLVVSPVFSEVWSDREDIDWQGARIQVVSREGLSIMKTLAGRPQDLADLAQLGIEVEP